MKSTRLSWWATPTSLTNSSQGYLTKLDQVLEVITTLQPIGQLPIRHCCSRDGGCKNHCILAVITFIMSSSDGCCVDAFSEFFLLEAEVGTAPTPACMGRLHRHDVHQFLSATQGVHGDNGLVFSGYHRGRAAGQQRAPMTIFNLRQLMALFNYG